MRQGRKEDKEIVSLVDEDQAVVDMIIRRNTTTIVFNQLDIRNLYESKQKGRCRARIKERNIQGYSIKVIIQLGMDDVYTETLKLNIIREDIEPMKAYEMEQLELKVKRKWNYIIKMINQNIHLSKLLKVHIKDHYIQMF